MKKVLKIIAIILCILLILLCIHTIRNYLIISNLQKKISAYTNSNHYHVASVTQEQQGTSTKIDYYKKENKEVLFVERTTNGTVTKMATYGDGQTSDLFVDTSNEKTARLNIDSTIMSVTILDYLQNAGTFQTILSSMMTRIRSVTINEKECYEICYFPSLALWEEGNDVAYIEKDTGLCLKNSTQNTFVERTYEFNNVDDSIFVEPDISEYTIKE